MGSRITDSEEHGAYVCFSGEQKKRESDNSIIVVLQLWGVCMNVYMK